MHGACYAFPAALGAMGRGMATSVGAPILAEHFGVAVELPPVWPDANGQAWGPMVTPLHAKAPAAARRDDGLYAVLSLLDAIRVGAARERELATRLLAERFA